MYIPFTERKKRIHNRVYTMVLVPKTEWELFTTNIYIPFYAGLTNKNNDNINKLFSFYYTIEDTLLKIENIKYINQTPLFANTRYKEMYYESLFKTIIEHAKTCNRTAKPLKSLFLSSQDPLSVNEMINNKFSIRKKQISDNKCIYMGLLTDGITSEKTNII